MKSKNPQGDYNTPAPRCQEKREPFGPLFAFIDIIQEVEG